jgi:ribosome maturation factor RimP
MDLNNIKKHIEPLIEEMGYELNSITYRRDKKDQILSLILDRVEPINMDDISLASSKISELLDELDVIEENYLLDVSSLGVEKPLNVTKLSLYVGSYVNVKLKNPVKGIETIEGTIESVDEKNLTISYMVKTKRVQIEIELTNIAKIRLAVKF